MSHLIPSGSATGNPRNKTALGPGKSLMDWVKLTNSGKDLSGTGGVMLNITPEELAQHNKETDAWMAIGGIVYNVTEYLSFHPGGEEELMRGVGTDATKLFNTVHSWVNYQSLLKSCIVGRLKTIGNSTILTSASSDSVNVRSYTPISFIISHPEIRLSSSIVHFLVKEYKIGSLSRRLCSLKRDDHVEMSRPVGSFNCKALDKRLNLILIAAGTGLTPFTSLIAWALKNSKLNVKLVFFNKTEEDIIWKNEFDTLSSDESRFEVTYILSNPSPNWKGLTGLVSALIIKPILIQPVEENFVCICGPNLFTELCVSIIKDIGYSENDFHRFQG
ncbi:hypothetical protein V9T40_003503 [Parthenolecanium corni]|uniref:Cytochrome b5 heme-binding domain-containing protein n=1 Tax=Parthenolecanium corni TaxID=536013 RepID=A0AAN9TQS0_9HEMI